MRFKVNLVKDSKKNIIRKVINQHYGFSLSDELYTRFINPENRSTVLNDLLCNYVKHYFYKTNLNKNNLHRWCLTNRNKTENENNYPW